LRQIPRAFVFISVLLSLSKPASKRSRYLRTLWYAHSLSKKFEYSGPIVESFDEFALIAEALMVTGPSLETAFMTNSVMLTFPSFSLPAVTSSDPRKIVFCKAVVVVFLSICG
jgi:hypothetical protein